MKILAVLTAYNEADVIGAALEHLLTQGIEVHLLDNWSTDGTPDLAREYPEVRYERWPANKLDQTSLQAILNRETEIILRSGAAWCIHQDADEIRRSPVPGETLAAGIARVAAQGFNAINHQVFTFHPTDNGFEPDTDPESYFRHYDTMAVVADRIQVKACMVTPRLRFISGGHMADFPSIRISEEMFVLKHYPIRSQAHGERKVFQERNPRWSPIERRMGWHVHYNSFQQGHQFLRDPATLQYWNTPAGILPSPLKLCMSAEVATMRRICGIGVGFNRRRM